MFTIYVKDFNCLKAYLIVKKNRFAADALFALRTNHICRIFWPWCVLILACVGNVSVLTEVKCSEVLFIKL